MNAGKKNLQAKKIEIRGLVQGVGFRPFIYNLALQHGLQGWVKNTTTGVIIHAEGESKRIDQFTRDISGHPPVAAKINDIIVGQATNKGFRSFSIEKSKSGDALLAEVSPDIAVCNQCLEDMKSQPHRVNYPLINCTNCGPRFTIIRNLPYDRDKTTMAGFTLCERCQKEYNDVSDRRFHAQPVACNQCGPRYLMTKNKLEIHDITSIIKTCADSFHQGEVIAMKGVGGYHLACDAMNEIAVNNLRTLKHRDKKPFAVMFRDIQSVTEYCNLSSSEEEKLLSWQRPIVLLKNRRQLPFSISEGLNTTGVILPFMPFHHLLFEHLKTNAIVLTSGNLTDEPIIIDNKIAREKLASASGGVISYNRDINNRTDDSVVFIANNKPRIIRRSRGYVPRPVRTKFDLEGIFAPGAELTNCFAIGKDKQAILSQHIGDLKNMETYAFYKESYHLFERLYQFKPRLAISDLHPDYLSTQFANNLGVNTKKVQHHYAHTLSVMAEHGINEKVIGISLDGTGHGTDGNTWGSEFMVCDYQGFTTMNSFEYLPLPGGDMVTKQPWRTAVSYLHQYFGEEFINWKLPFTHGIDKNTLALVIAAIEKKINTPLSRGAGRLFDAVSALINLCPVSGYHAEAPMRLEAIIDHRVSRSYDYNPGKTISFKPLFKGILDDLQKKVPTGEISAKFHHTISRIILEIGMKIREETGINIVCLSGGVFQNRFILSRSENLLSGKGFEVYSNIDVPVNDAGIALGQLAYGAHNG